MARVGLNRVTCNRNRLQRSPWTVWFNFQPFGFSRQILKPAPNGCEFRRPAVSGIGVHDVEDYLPTFN
ncbi:hypothetical protein N7447_003056 [Penicillium robsamsonii]|uniref:uncharacterized protein n=1 Tax=Penicillium robsamsonii TaxID=1792511 RepID=UPI0025479214|nr:uncharacterized protein N7447_003056 [Penicillium robsamsonii]KAJ5837030.1 hypothetical protein N7447_003056 [Penicillium robsamsonii]